MTLVVIEPAELRNLIEEAVVCAVGRAKLTDEWLDARTSPIGRRAFLKLARAGAFPVSRVGNKFMARRSDVDAYLERQRIHRESPRREVDAVPSPLRAGVDVASNDDPVARALAAGRLRIVKKSP